MTTPTFFLAFSTTVMEATSNAKIFSNYNIRKLANLKQVYVILSTYVSLLMILCLIAANTPPVKYDSTKVNELERLKNAVNALRATGGGDCPEYGMKGILDTIISIKSINNLIYSNVIVLTDASAKDPDLKDSVINLAKQSDLTRGPVVVHFFLSERSFCPSGYSEYEDIAEATCGVVMNKLVDLSAFSEFADKAKVTDCPDERKKRSSTSCVTFDISVFTESVNILFNTFSSIITITIPGGSKVLVKSSGSYASFSRDNPTAGVYSACSSGSFNHIISLTSSFDFAVEYYSNSSSDLTAGNIKCVCICMTVCPIPIFAESLHFYFNVVYFLGMHQNIIVSSSQISKVNTNHTVLLQLISNGDTVLQAIKLSLCGELLFGNITIPDSPYRHKLQGIDYKGYKFSKTKPGIQRPSPPPTPTYATSVPTTSTCPCHNYGKCQIFRRFGREFVRCICPTGFRGSRCQDGKEYGCLLT